MMRRRNHKHVKRRESLTLQVQRLVKFITCRYHDGKRSRSKRVLTLLVACDTTGLRDRVEHSTQKKPARMF